MPLIPKQHRKRLSAKELLGQYQEWYKVKFSEEALLTEEIFVRNFGHILYAKLMLAIYAILKYDVDDLFLYCDFVFKSWSETSGHGATIKYFPNWLASQAMIDQFGQSIKTAKIKRKTESHPTYSDHSYVGESKDVVFVPSGVMYGSKPIHRN